MARSVGKSYHLPDNPTYVSFPDSDGDSSQWPSNTTRVEDSDGHVNYYDPQGLDSPASIRWRVQVGDSVALALEWDKSKTYVLQDWPRDYAFYVHNKGPREKPRQDVYLMGGPSRFRSVFEFVPHAVWLFRNQSVPCACKYCTKQPQKTITSSLSAILRFSPGRASPSIRPSKQSNRIKSHLREQKIYATVQKVLLNASKNLSGTMVVERNQDLRAINARTDMKLRRYFREGELLWCALDRPIPGQNGDDDAIVFWPGLVDEAKLNSQSLPSQDGAANQDSVPWTVSQSTIYKVKLIATSDMISIADDRVLPYQAYVPPPSLIETLSQTPPIHFDFDKEHLSNFHPFPQSLEHTRSSFTDAVSAYALALQIGSAVAQLWSLTDEWDFKYTIPPAISQQPASLQAALNMASSSGSLSQDTSTSGLIGSSSRIDILGVVPPGSSSASRSQTRFQGLWWGAERIWTDDFVRLKIPRRCLAPAGAQNILPPAGPGATTRTTCTTYNLNPAEFGAGTRGVFMKLEGLFTVDVPLSDGTLIKECRASGMLYELADADWDEVTPPSNQNSATLPMIDPRSSSAQLSHPPRSAQYLLPEAPPGFKFREILPEGYECVLSLTLISGRYYPKILAHPLLADRIARAAQADPEQLHASDYLWALEGLAAGYTNAVDPERFMPNRLKMLEEADKNSRSQLEKHRDNAMEGGDNADYLMDFEDN